MPDGRHVRTPGAAGEIVDVYVAVANEYVVTVVVRMNRKRLFRTFSFLIR